MYSTSLILLTGIAAILYFVYLFIIEEQRKQLQPRKNYWTVKDDKGGIYFVKNLQMNVVNNQVGQQAIPIYSEESVEGNYLRSRKVNVDSVIN